MKQFLLTLAGVFAGLLLFFVGLPFLLITMLVAGAKPAPAPANTVLSLDLRQALTDQEAQNPFANFGERQLSVMSVVSTLKRAGADGRVKGLLVRLPEGGVAPAAADEIAGALRAFRATGKPVIAHSQGLYPSGQPVATYMLGAASGAYWMQPSASLQATGAAAEDLFLKRAFDKYGITPDYQQRYEYKNAVNPYLYDDYTPQHREAELGWMGSVYDSEVVAAAADRKLAAPALKAALEAGPYLAEDAQAKGLIDRVAQVSDAEGALKAKAGSGAQLVDFGAYRQSLASASRGNSGPAVAVIQAEGAIETGSSRDKGFGGGSGTIYSDDVAKAFSTAARDAAVKAIVFRVSSPGGGDTASEQILAGVREAKAAGKPVVVSMGTYAASGGYWISSQASEIVAQPTTLTGSIGVFGGKFAIGPALARFGLDSRTLSVGGPYADAFNGARPFTPEQRAAFAGWMDRIYAGFIGRVAEGRRLPEARVREIAKGRVWTGAQALQLGLVDKLGGFDVALAEAKRLGGVSGESVTLKSISGKASTFDAIGRLFGMSAQGAETLAGAQALLRDPRAAMALDLVTRARLESSHQAAVLAPLPLR